MQLLNNAMLLVVARFHTGYILLLYAQQSNGTKRFSEVPQVRSNSIGTVISHISYQRQQSSSRP